VLIAAGGGAAPGAEAGAAATTFSYTRALADALSPLSTGIIIAIVALVAYDGLLIRVEKLSGELDRVGTETIDAIAMMAPVSSPTIPAAAPAAAPYGVRTDAGPKNATAPAHRPHHLSVRVDEGADRGRRFSEPETGF
jgi:hypothetical protein